MTTRLVIASVQANPTVGAVTKNEALARKLLAEAREQGADIALFSELFLIGYPPEDLALKPAAVAACRASLDRLAKETAKGCACIIGLLWPGEGGRPRNAVALLADGEIKAVTFKADLPNYGVFDEKRVFEPGETVLFRYKGVAIGVPVCEDIWRPDVCAELKAQGAKILLVPNGSPFRRTADDERIAVARARVEETGLPLVYVNQVGGQDELVFEGASFALQADGSVCMSLGFCEEVLALSTWEKKPSGWTCVQAPKTSWPSLTEAIYRAMVVGLRDYVEKSGFPGVLLGMSGGIDSALTAAVAADALGAGRVRCVMLPSRYTSSESFEDASACARTLGCPYEEILIEPAVAAFEAMLAGPFAGRRPDLTEENIQARIRGVTLMALSNKFGLMLMTTGNKSEMAVGYATLYGDMCGGYSVLKDVYKMTVFALSRWRNAHVPAGGLGPAGEVIPESIIVRPPTAELRENQLDQDSLPPYEQLDAILEMLIEKEMPVRDIVATGQPEDVVRRIQHMLYVAEYKRRQAPPGVKITARNFGRDRRYPITNAFRDLSK